VKGRKGASMHSWHCSNADFEVIDKEVTRVKPQLEVTQTSKKMASIPSVKNETKSKTEVTAEVDAFQPLGKRKLVTGIALSGKYNTVQPQSAPTLLSPLVTTIVQVRCPFSRR
jgi:hypothetical protein